LGNLVEGNQPWECIIQAQYDAGGNNVLGFVAIDPSTGKGCLQWNTTGFYAFDEFWSPKLTDIIGPAGIN
jgi:hypothetical protein